jgi:hypothetical protein
MTNQKSRAVALGFLALLAIGRPGAAMSDDPAPTSSGEIREIRRAVRQLQEDRERDRVLIDKLLRRLDQVEGQNRELKASNQQLQGQTTQQIKELETKVETGPSATGFSDAFGRYLGSHSFTVTGAAGFDFIYDQQSAALDGLSHETQNTFLFDWEPMVLYRPTDWILFEGVLSGSFGQAGTGTDLSTAEFQLFLNNYMTVVGGLFDQPFGDWFEAQSPMWVNRFVTAPLPFGVEPVVPPGEVGIQLRSGFQWGQLGQDFDYTAWIANGPNFSQPVLGAVMGGPTAIAFSQTHSKAFGGRFRLYPIPVDSDLGRLELGASTYDGKWLDGHWLTSWGVDFNYLYGSLQARGEWLESYRQMPGPLAADNRQGWYLQLGYFLSGLNLAFLPDAVSDRVHRLEPLVRYSGVNQRGVAIDDITGATGVGVGGIQAGLIPDFGLSGSPALFAPHSREVALALDYYVTPSIVWQNEFDIELPRAAGVFVSSSGTTTPVGSVPNDRAFLSQFTVGF